MIALETASVLGLHEFRVAPQRGRTQWPLVVLSDARTGEPIAAVTPDEAQQLAEWLERERPLGPRPIPYRVLRDALQVELGLSKSDAGHVARGLPARVLDR